MSVTSLFDIRERRDTVTSRRMPLNLPHHASRSHPSNPTLDLAAAAKAQPIAERAEKNSRSSTSGAARRASSPSRPPRCCATKHILLRTILAAHRLRPRLHAWANSGAPQTNRSTSPSRIAAWLGQHITEISPTAGCSAAGLHHFPAEQAMRSIKLYHPESLPPLEFLRAGTLDDKRGRRCE